MHAVVLGLAFVGEAGDAHSAGQVLLGDEVVARRTRVEGTEHQVEGRVRAVVARAQEEEGRLPHGEPRRAVNLQPDAVGADAAGHAHDDGAAGEVTLHELVDRDEVVGRRRMAGGTGLDRKTSATAMTSACAARSRSATGMKEVAAARAARARATGTRQAARWMGLTAISPFSVG